MIEAQTAQLVTKDMTMGEIIEKYPAAADVMQSYGLHCFGCHVNLFESLEQGVLGHGMSEQDMNNLLSDLNKLASGSEQKETAEAEEKAELETAQEDFTLTELAASKLKELLQKQGKGEEYGIRIQVVRGGCAGYMYNMDFERVQQANDTLTEKHGVKLFVDNDSFRMLKDITVDYVESLQGAGFKFDNPNSKGECGCGKSFH